MKFSINFKKNPYGDCFSVDEYEDASDLLLILEEFKFLYIGYLILDFGDGRILEVDYDFEFIVEHEEFLDIIEFIEDENRNECSIWVCEQGSDYYINHYKKKDGYILIEIKKGPDSSSFLNEFCVMVPVDDYKNEWIRLYRELFIFIVDALPKYRYSKEILRYIKPALG